MDTCAFLLKCIAATKGKCCTFHGAAAGEMVLPFRTKPAGLRFRPAGPDGWADRELETGNLYGDSL